ncbi:MAG TPA: outer membrane beta-barrel protein [Blastocatellia bacterium]|nr:outer membrane beta-barrel protein [Blastocatellia bacterium]
MKKLFMMIAVLFAAAIPAQAQDSYPSAEIFGGYAYFNADVFEREHLHGFGVSFTGNLGPRVGLVAEFSGHYGSIDIPGDELDFSTYTFLFGPRFSARSDRVTAFGHVLLGGVRSKVEDFDGVTDFAMAIGGGVDVTASSSIGIRVFQADYVPVRSSGDWSHNFRLMAGIVLRLGSE